MKRASLILTALVVSKAGASAQEAQECRPLAAGVWGVRAVATGIIAADNSRDLDRVLGYYAPDAVLMPPDESAVVGREKIRVR